IRDFHVTGVQTCALPISDIDLVLSVERTSSDTEISFGLAVLPIGSTTRELVTSTRPVASGVNLRISNAVLGGSSRSLESSSSDRSEERRVGKECRSQWSR